MTIQTGISENIKVEEKSGGNTNITNRFGLLLNSSHTVVQPTETRGSIGSGAQPMATIDRVAEISGDIVCNPPKLRILEVFGNFIDNGDGTFTVNPTDTLETYTFKQQKVSGGGTVTLDDFKFGSFSLTAEEDSELELTLDGQALDFSASDSETITTETPDKNVREFFNAVVKIDGTAVGSVESFTVDFNRNLESFKGIEDDAAGEKRKPSVIIEKLFDISYDITINVENLRAYEEALDDSSSPYEIQDSRSNVDIEIVLDTADGQDTLTLSNTRSDEVSSEQSADVDKVTATITGVAQDWQVNGDLP